MSSDEVIFEDGGRGDLDGVLAVMADSFDPAYGEAWTGPQCAGLLPMNGVWLSLARTGEGVVGFALARVIANEAELLLLAVRRDRQNRGIGAKLLARFEAAAADKGAERLHLEVRDGNPALRLYRHSGYREVGRRRNYYTGVGGQLFDALTLAKRSGD